MSIPNLSVSQQAAIGLFGLGVHEEIHLILSHPLSLTLEGVDGGGLTTASCGKPFYPFRTHIRRSGISHDIILQCFNNLQLFCIHQKNDPVNSCNGLTMHDVGTINVVLVQSMN